MSGMRLWLNSDVGERPEALADGSEAELIRLLDWANIACGGHAGDEATMTGVVRLCRQFGVQIGAHPGYPDREHFGRAALDLPPEVISRLVCEQVQALDDIARATGAAVCHVKPHGALYNQASSDRSVAAAVGEGVRRCNRGALLVGLAGTVMLDVWKEQGFAVASEVFADRRYAHDGSLRPRSLPGALISNPEEAADQARLAAEGLIRTWEGREIPARADTVCIHSDTPGAPAIARAIRRLRGEIRRS